MSQPHLKIASVCVCSVVSKSLQPQGLQPARLLCPSDFPGKNTGVGCHFLLHGICPTQELNLGLPASPALAGRFFTTVTPGKAPRVTWEAFKKYRCLLVSGGDPRFCFHFGVWQSPRSGQPRGLKHTQDILPREEADRRTTGFKERIKRVARFTSPKI